MKYTVKMTEDYSLYLINYTVNQMVLYSSYLVINKASTP